MKTYEIIGLAALIFLFYFVAIMEYIEMRRDDPFKEENIDSK